MKKQELIDTLAPALIAEGGSRKDVQSVLETYSVPQLEELVRKQQNQNSGLKTEAEKAIKSLEALLDVRKKLRQSQSERENDWIEFQVQQGLATLPERQAEAERQLAHDKVTFADAAKAFRSFGMTEANLNVIRQILGPGFTQYALSQALASNALQLSPPSQQELREWAAQDVQDHNEALLRADDVTLRARVRQEAEHTRVATAQAEATRQFQAAQKRDAVMGFPPLPDVWQGEKLDAAFIKNCSVEVHKLLTKRFGAAQITARLQGRS